MSGVFHFGRIFGSPPSSVSVKIWPNLQNFCLAIGENKKLNSLNSLLIKWRDLYVTS